MTQEQTELIKEMYNYYQYTWDVDGVNNFQCKIKETFPDLFKVEKYEPKVGECGYSLIRHKNYQIENQNQFINIFT